MNARARIAFEAYQEAARKAAYLEFYEDQVRHRNIDVDGCQCAGCQKVRQRDKEQENHRLFRKALNGIRRQSSLLNRCTEIA